MRARPAVLAAFHGFSGDLEGARVPFLYLDNAEPLGLVTIGTGNLADPLSVALFLPLVHPEDGRPATQAEKTAAWLAVKGRQDLKRHGGMVFRHVTTLRLTEEGLDRLVDGKLASVCAQLASKYPDWDAWPCDAQLFRLSHAWARGAMPTDYPKMEAALLAGDFETAADECTLNPQKGTIITRNYRNRILLRNAARVVRGGLDPGVLYYPADLYALEQEDTPTAPDLDAYSNAERPTTYVAVPPEEVTGSGDIIHPLRYPLDEDPDDDAA